MEVDGSKPSAGENMFALPKSLYVVFSLKVMYGEAIVRQVIRPQLYSINSYCGSHSVGEWALSLRAFLTQVTMWGWIPYLLRT
jgi:hypothetical protein